MARLTPRKPKKVAKSDQVAALQGALTRLSSERLDIFVDLGDIGVEIKADDFVVLSRGLTVDDRTPYTVWLRKPS
jgi:hypothetical protein